MTDSVTRILLIRHGMNDYLVTRRLAGRLPGVHLNDEGHSQAQALGERLASTPLAAVYSSPLERTVETAQPIAASHGLPVVPLEEVGEAICGEWVGQPIEELRKTDLWQQMRASPSDFRYPGGESVGEMQARMVAALESLRTAHPEQTVVVVSHSDPIKAALAHYLGMALDLYERLMIAPASITELHFTQAGPRLARCNDCAYLPKDFHP